jgi:hypothetical protein
MRRLENALDDHDLTTLRVIGEWWELDLAGSNHSDCVKALANKLVELNLEQESRYLPAEDAAALMDLVAHRGRMPVASFSREHGEVRMMGPGRLEREEPWLDPVSAAEALWYRGFLYRGFDETAEGMIEFYFLPQELLEKLSQQESAASTREADLTPLDPVPAPPDAGSEVTDAVDDLTTLLALIQKSSARPSAQAWGSFLLDPDADRTSLLFKLAQEKGMVRTTEGGAKLTRSALEWLKLGREAQLRALADAWSNSGWNELFHTPGLLCEGEGWRNDPILARTALLDALPRTEGWFSLAALISLVKETDPDFQRPDGNYDTWYIREAGSANYLTGFQTWDNVEGRLLRYLLEGPCSWLGLVVRADRADDRLFRLSARALDWLANKPPKPDPIEVPLVVSADGTVLVPFNASRLRRFQAARISEEEPVRPGQPFSYRISPGSLERAQQQGISLERVMRFFKEASGRPLPTGFERALNRWSENGIEARMEQLVVLKVREATILETLRANPKTRDFLGESLGELATVVRHEDWPKLAAASAALGLLLDVQIRGPLESESQPPRDAARVSTS